MENIFWNLNSVTPSPEYKDELVSLSASLVALLNKAESGEIDTQEWLPAAIDSLNHLTDLSENLMSFTYAVWSVDTSDEDAQSEMDNLEERSLMVKDALVRFRALLSGLDGWEEIFKQKSVSSYRFWLEEQQFLGQHQMTFSEEALAADLQRCGGDAWDRLHSRLSSVLSRPWDGDDKSLTQLRSLAYDSDRSVRKRAWEEETAAWKAAEVSFAAALNGVKGTTVTLNSRRGWGSTLEKSLVQNRLSRTALDAMLGVMNESLPLFRRYFRAKAKMLGIPKLGWYDLFAPVGSSDEKWTWERVSNFIPEMFDTLSVDM
ncbi:MAG: peptidase M3, partial [Spirochaetaceae bacterium]|nr:peptidase M3 [Spirochaetaceae bacterium]